MVWLRQGTKVWDRSWTCPPVVTVSGRAWRLPVVLCYLVAVTRFLWWVPPLRRDTMLSLFWTAQGWNGALSRDFSVGTSGLLRPQRVKAPPPAQIKASIGSRMAMFGHRWVYTGRSRSQKVALIGLPKTGAVSIRLSPCSGKDGWQLKLRNGGGMRSRRTRLGRV